MLRIRIPLALPLAAAALAAASLASASPQSSSKGASKTKAASGKAAGQDVERGRYLVTMMGCQDCHTPGFFYGAPDMSRQLSGSELGWQGPWGVSYPANLTPDPETGLGKWTDEQIVTAIRTGVRADGSVLLPPMPWQNYAGLTDDDARAIVAYLRSIPAVKHQEPKAIPPGGAPKGPVMTIPPPPAWDAPKGPPPAGGGHGAPGKPAQQGDKSKAGGKG